MDELRWPNGTIVRFYNMADDDKLRGINNDPRKNLRNLYDRLAESFLDMSDEALDNYIRNNPKEILSALHTRDSILEIIKNLKKEQGLKEKE